MQFERSVISESLHISNNRMAFVLAAVIGQFAIQVAGETAFSSIGLTFANAMIWSMLAFIAHSETLPNPEKNLDKDISRTFGFAVRSVCLVVLAVLPCFAIVSALPQSADPDVVIGAFMVALVPAFAAMNLLVFSLLGTILPAYVTGEDRGLGRALARGMRQFFWLISRLAIPAGLAILAAIILVVPVALLGNGGNYLSGGYIPNPQMMPFALIAYAIMGWAVIMTAVILSRAYLRDREQVETVSETPDLSVSAQS